MSACGLHFHFKDANRLSLSCGLIICLTAIVRLGLPPQGQHQPGPLLRHAGHPEETHRKQEMTGRGRQTPHTGHLIRPPAPSPPGQEHLGGGGGGETSVPPPQRLFYTWLVGQRSSRKETEIDKLCFLLLFFFVFVSAHSDQPTSRFVPPLTPHGRYSSP